MKNFKVVFTLASLSVFVLYLMAGITSISPGEVGIKIKMLDMFGDAPMGMQQETLDTGVYWIEPIAFDVSVYDVRQKQYEDKLTGMESQTKDGQPITVDISLEIGLVDAKVPYLHEKVGRNWFDEVVYPALRSAVRNNTTSQDSDVIYTAMGRAEVQARIQSILESHLSKYGITIFVNLRDVNFTNTAFIATLEKKAQESQNVIINERQALAAEHTAIKMANLADGEKQKRIKAAEAQREELRLQGEGERLQKEEQAKGILAIAQAQAEGTRLQVNAYGSGKTYASVKWAEHLGPNVKVWGVPTGTPGTSTLMDLNGLVQGAFGGVK